MRQARADLVDAYLDRMAVVAGPVEDCFSGLDVRGTRSRRSIDESQCGQGNGETHDRQFRIMTPASNTTCRHAALIWRKSEGGVPRAGGRGRVKPWSRGGGAPFVSGLGDKRSKAVSLEQGRLLIVMA